MPEFGATMPKSPLGGSLDTPVCLPPAPPPQLLEVQLNAVPMVPTIYAQVHTALAEQHGRHMRNGDDTIAPGIAASSAAGIFHLNLSAAEGNAHAQLVLSLMYQHLRPKSAYAALMVHLQVPNTSPALPQHFSSVSATFHQHFPAVPHRFPNTSPRLYIVGGVGGVLGGVGGVLGGVGGVLGGVGGVLGGVGGVLGGVGGVLGGVGSVLGGVGGVLAVVVGGGVAAGHPFFWGGGGFGFRKRTGLTGLSGIMTSGPEDFFEH